MNYELLQKCFNGEMPDSYYSVANSKAELIALIEQLEDAVTITKDTPIGERFHFGKTVEGRFFFETDEFLDEDGEKENPNYHSARYDSAKEGVENFKLNGKDLVDAVKGCRFLANDCPVIYD